MDSWPGLETSMDSPVLGHGLHKANQAVALRVQSSNYQKRIAGYTHLHNEFVNTLVGKGLLGLASLLLLLFGPIALLGKCLKAGTSYTCASMGILVCSGYALFGLTNLAFGHGIMNTFYVFFLSITLNLVILLRTTRTSQKTSEAGFPSPMEINGLKSCPVTHSQITFARSGESLTDKSSKPD